MKIYLLRSSFIKAVTVFYVLTVLGCATAPAPYLKESYVKESWLPFIQNNKTTKMEIIKLLGEPTEYFEKGRIFAYRLILENPEHRATINDCNPKRSEELVPEKGDLLVIRENKKEDRYLDIVCRVAEYSLVIVFDENDVQLRHSLIRVSP